MYYEQQKIKDQDLPVHLRKENKINNLVNQLYDVAEE